MSDHSFFVYFLLVTLLNYVCDGANDKQNSTFQPTSEWQKIEEGQSIPPGLHVRINLETGYKEAKIPDDKSEKTALSVVKEESENTDNNGSPLSRDELKKIMKNIKSDDDGSEGSVVAGKFRSYEELKRELSELNAQIKTDTEMIHDLLEDFKTILFVDSNDDSIENDYEFDEEDILSNLLNLEYLLHHYDNGVEFAKQNGFSVVIHKCLNSSNSEIRLKALAVHGSATQSNPKAQIAALDSGSMNLLLKMLTLDLDLNVRAKSIYALSCLLRGFPAAQQKLISDGGLAVFAGIFDEEDEEKKDLFLLQSKIITLLYDLMHERKDTKIRIAEVESKNEKGAELSTLKERLRQYERMDLEKKLVEENYCEILSSWYVKQNFLTTLQESKNDPTRQSPTSYIHDVVERVTDALEIMADICKSQFQKESEFLAMLNEMSLAYARLTETEAKRNDTDDDDEDDDDDGILLEQYNNLLSRLKSLAGKLENIPQPKEEL